MTKLAAIAAFEAAQNPDGGDLNSNPFSLVVHGGNTYVSDAGGNTLLKANSVNEVSLVNVFEGKLVTTSHLPFPFPFDEVLSEAVPTGMTIGPDGALYITLLSGFPFAPGSADVFRYDFINDGMVEMEIRQAGAFEYYVEYQEEWGHMKDGSKKKGSGQGLTKEGSNNKEEPDHQGSKKEERGQGSKKEYENNEWTLAKRRGYFIVDPYLTVFKSIDDQRVGAPKKMEQFILNMDAICLQTVVPKW
jgi:hypothetical protein